MKLTKLQRYTAYCIMLAEAKNRLSYWGLCLLAWECLHLTEKDGFSDFTYCLKAFPEIMKHEPEEYDRFWFPKERKGWEKRIAILKQCIIETHP